MLDVLTDELFDLIARYLLMHPRSAAALARTARFARAPLKPILTEFKTLLDVCHRAVGITTIAQFATIGLLMFHDILFTAEELKSVALVISSDVTPRVSELCFYNSGGPVRGFGDAGLAALIGALRPGQRHTGAAGRLRYVAITNQDITRAGLEPLFKCIAAGEFRRLRLLDLSTNPACLPKAPPVPGQPPQPRRPDPPARAVLPTDGPDGLRILGYNGEWTIDMPGVD